MNRRAGVAMFLAVLLGTTALAWALGGAADGPPTAHPTPRSPSTPTTARAETTPTPSPPPTPTPTKAPPKPKPTLRPGPQVLGAGATGDRVRDLQSRLRQIGWYAGDVTGTYSTRTSSAVRGFQQKRRIPATGYVDRRTLSRLAAMTRAPTDDELHNRVPAGGSTRAALDPRCSTGRAMCIDKTSQTVRWVVGGKVLRTMDVRFGASYAPTREGVFSVESKDASHVSHLYGSAMPYSMFFSRGQAVHYSSDFAARGYAGASHGCVNVRDHAGIEWLFGQVRVGDKVVVYWS